MQCYQCIGHGLMLRAGRILTRREIKDTRRPIDSRRSPHTSPDTAGRHDVKYVLYRPRRGVQLHQLPGCMTAISVSRYADIDTSIEYRRRTIKEGAWRRSQWRLPDDRSRVGVKRIEAIVTATHENHGSI